MFNELMILITFPIIWVMSWITHELMHALECKRQGAGEATIYYYFYGGWIPALQYKYMGIIENKKLVNLAGGLYTGILLLIIGLYAGYTPTQYDLNIEAAFIIIGVLQLVYGLFEWKYLGVLRHDLYMKRHYQLYAAILIIMIIFYALFRL